MPPARHHETGPRLRRRVFAFALICLLAGCLSATREQLEQCTATAAVTYPSTKAIPLGQPYKDILACMQEAGYIVDNDGDCRYIDYAASVTDARCYRPAGAISGYFHDVGKVFR